MQGRWEEAQTLTSKGKREEIKERDLGPPGGQEQSRN